MLRSSKIHEALTDFQVYIVGDRVQAKWDDGKMYFGKVLQVHEGMV